MRSKTKEAAAQEEKWEKNEKRINARQVDEGGSRGRREADAAS